MINDKETLTVAIMTAISLFHKFLEFNTSTYVNKMNEILMTETRYLILHL